MAIKIWIAILCWLTSFTLLAEQTTQPPEITHKKRVSTNKARTAEQQAITKIEYYKNNNETNQIPYLNNRFRIDAMLDEITMVFYRKRGSKPVILIQPDGSKIRVNHPDKERVKWYDAATFDMITIKKPMPGPWQAVGNILPNSEILVVSDVKIVVPPLPEIMLSGETIKVEGRLENGGQAIDNPLFRDVVELKVEFVSTNNSAYENFGAELVELTTFRDDGRDLDEYAKDGIFTGEFNLNIPAGEWIPIYKVNLPMAQRELKQKPVMLQKNPINITVDITKQENSYHVVHFHIDPSYVEPESVIFQGQITYPDKQSEPFSIMEGEGLVKEDKNDRTHQFGYTEPGVHRINVNVFGKTKNGREFRLVVPEYTFNVELTQQELLEHIDDINSSVPTETEAEKLAREQAELEQKLAEEKAIKEAELAKQQKQRWIIIGAGNGVVVLAAIGFVLWQRRKKQKQSVTE